MSSLRNAVKRRVHKERAQPSDRRKYGLLEKHKDYVLRARDYHKKEKTIRNLMEKAAERNPDEFYYKMINSKTVDGTHRPQNLAKQYTHEELQLMKTQDIAYVLSKAQSEQKKVERLRAVLQSPDQPPANTHIYFANDRDEAKELGQVLYSNRSKRAPRSSLPKKIQKMHETAYRELQERTERAIKLKRVFLNMTLQKELMGKGKKRKLSDEEIVSPSDVPVYRWRRERKK